VDGDLTLTATFGRSYPYILARVFAAVAIIGGAAFALFVFLRRARIIRRRGYMRGGRPGHRGRPRERY
jgi:hypothetical protein